MKARILIPAFCVIALSAQNIERTLREGNRQFQRELSTAVQLLSGAVKNLGDVVDDIPVRK